MSYVKPTEIIKATASKLGIPVKLVTGITKKREVVETRFIAMHTINQFHPGLTPAAIGKSFKRDRTSVMYALKKYDELLGDKAFNSKASQVAEYFKNKYQ